MVHSIADPFTPRSGNQRYPDSGAGKTLTQSVRGVFTVNCDANGNAFLALGSKSNYVLITAETGTILSNTITPSSLWELDSASLLTSFANRWRLVSGGIRVNNILPALTSQGTLDMFQSTEVQVSTPFLASPMTTINYESHPYGAGKRFQAVLKPNGDAAYAMVLNTTYASATDGSNPHWYDQCFFWRGVASGVTAVARVEVYMNYEFTVNIDSGVAVLAQPQPVYNPAAISAINDIQSNASPHGEAGKHSTSLKSHATRALTKHVLPALGHKALDFVEHKLAKKSVAMLTDGIVEVN